MDMTLYQSEDYRLLVRAILSLETEQECAAFLEDLLTRRELADMAQRMQVADLLSRREVYSKIAQKTGASTATISRVNRAYNYGPGGYATVLKRLNEENPKA